jgi:sporulation protein YlmC with PRC-barrel domain
MEISLNAHVICQDGRCGRVTRVIVHPWTEQITHIVVKSSHAPHEERLVPVELVTETTKDAIHLKCTQESLSKRRQLVEEEWLSVDIPKFEAVEYLTHPLVVPAHQYVPIKHERIPYGELQVRRGARVAACDGYIGKVAEFLIEPDSGHVTHLILREGHLGGRDEIAIPISEIHSIEGDTVALTISKEDVRRLPAIPVRRPGKERSS